MSISPKDAEGVFSRASCLFNEAQVQESLDKIAEQITEQIADDNPLVLCVMTGGLMVSSELLKRLHFPLEVDYIHATRYGSEIMGDTLQWLAKPRKPLTNRSVLIIDDILDVGKTLHEIVNYCAEAGASKVLSAVLVEKIHDRKEGMHSADFTALQVPDKYVFGYGMDYKNYLRNSTGIYAAAKEDE